jgi:hypothetical protein
MPEYGETGGKMMDALEPNTIKVVKGIATRVWDGNFSYIIVAKDKTALYAILNNHLAPKVAGQFKEEKFKRVAIFHEGEPFA